MTMFSGKRVLITGVCGTVGSELLRQLVTDSSRYAPAEVIGIDTNESALFFLDQAFLTDCRVNLAIADVRDLGSLVTRFDGVDIVFHTAALKHVVLCERSPEQAIMTNIDGVQNVIAASQRAGAERVVFTSSDKAVNPTNVMGTSKLMGERLMTAANSNHQPGGTIFTSTRFGNVLGSSGSVFPIFRAQIANGGPVTLTHGQMTRFVMSIEESVRLVIDSASIACGGEVFVTKMPVVRIADLATAMIEMFAPIDGHDPSAIRIEEIGTKPGEKLYEELMSDEETRRALELERYFSVLPAFRGIYRDIDYCYDGIVNTVVSDPYVSTRQAALSISAIKRLLSEYGLADATSDAVAERYFPGDKESQDVAGQLPTRP